MLNSLKTLTKEQQALLKEKITIAIFSGTADAEMVRLHVAGSLGFPVTQGQFGEMITALIREKVLLVKTEPDGWVVARDFSRGA